MVGIFLSWEKSSQTTWLTAKLFEESVKKDFSYLTVLLNDPISSLFYYGQVVNYAFWQEIKCIKIFKCIWLLGDRTNVATTDLSETLPEEIEAEVKLAAEISMGTEVSEQDIHNIMHLCDQVCVVFFPTCS